MGLGVDSKNEVQAIRPAFGIGELLVGAQFVDAYRVTVAVSDLDATRAARAMIEHPPRWVDGLLALRHRLVFAVSGELHRHSAAT
jgi:hypothetical protein